MSGKFVRASKYRHVFGHPPKKELWYENVKVTLNAWDSNLIKTNGEFISVNWNTSAGGSFAVIPVKEHGKVPDVVPLFRGHTAQVLDTDFDPFDDYRVASSSDDAKIGIFQIPKDYTFFHRETDEEGEARDVHPVKMLAGHGRKVGHILFSPVAKDVLASSSLDRTIKIWNIETGKDEITLAHPDMVTSMSFSYDGNYLATVARDRKLRVWDIRAQNIVSECKAHEGAKSQRVVWLGNSNRLVTSGFSRISERQVALWDSFELEKGPLGKFYTVDQAPGVLMPFYDDGNKILFLVGKGDGNIRYYELQDDQLYELSEYLSTDPQRGFAAAPKRKLNLKDNEIMKCFKTVIDTCIEPISFYVPRRSEAFQHDIYPDAPSDKPALTADEWFGGKSVEGPLLINLKDLYEGSEMILRPAKKQEPKKEEPKKEEPRKEEPKKEEPNSNGVLTSEKTVDKLLKKSSDLDTLNDVEDPSKDTSGWDDDENDPKPKTPRVASKTDSKELRTKEDVKQPSFSSEKMKEPSERQSSKEEPKNEGPQEEFGRSSRKEPSKEEYDTKTGTKPLKLEQSAEKLSALVYSLEGVVEKLTRANLENSERLELLEAKIEHLLSREESH
ncbi:coronin-like protein crn1 [Zygosaccharomyces mellis]|uniref:Coronin n=1 Tax=Zygosaccharomyces mellis TaxID=42258 RepID=A0A4C2E3D6_9SACH|nr:coronin-like protein crn1 [Zygosaccharomyces mellis]